MVTNRGNFSDPVTRACAIGNQKASSSLLGTEGGHQGLAETKGREVKNDSSDYLLGSLSISDLLYVTSYKGLTAGSKSRVYICLVLKSTQPKM